MSTEHLCDNGPGTPVRPTDPLDRVIVVGAGPVGLATALGLVQANVPVVVLEKGDGPGTASRASTLHPPSLEFLRDLGVIEEVEELGLRSATYQLRGRAEGLIAEFDLGALAEETSFPYRVQLEQDKLCRILSERLRASPLAEVLTGHAVQSVTQDGDVVTAHATVDGAGLEVAGRWLVAADGAHSAVRRSLGIEHEGITYAERFLVVSTPDDLREVLPDIAFVNYVSDPVQWVVLLRTPDHWRLLFPVGPDEDADEVTAPDALQHRVQAVAPRAEPWPVAQASLYEIQQRVATTFRLGRVLLAGDAAHLNNPLGGLGMNSGLLDAWSLSQRLADVFLGLDDDDVLDAYASMRRRVALDVVDRETRANKARMEERDPTARAAHLADQRALAADPERLGDHLRRVTLLEVARTTL